MSRKKIKNELNFPLYQSRAQNQIMHNNEETESIQNFENTIWTGKTQIPKYNSTAPKKGEKAVH